VTVQVRRVTDSDLAFSFERYADQVRHPALELALFAAHLPDEAIDGDDDALPDLPDEQVRNARRRRGALLVAANMIFDQVTDDILSMTRADSRASASTDRFVDEFFPPRYRHLYDETFHRKLLATVAKVGYDLVNYSAGPPACTAEELVLWAVLQQWQSLLEMSELGPSWTDLAEDLFEDMDFETLYAADMDGIENDPLAHKTTGLVVNAIVDWFVPFNDDSIVHPYAVELDRSVPQLYDLTVDGGPGEVDLADPTAPTAPGTVRGLDPVSELVGAARETARSRVDVVLWVPDERDPERSLAEITMHAGSSGVLTLQPGPDAEITEVPVLEFRPHPAHPSTGQAWAGVFFMSGRSELPLDAVVCFEPDPSVRDRWEAIFRPSP
jgi:hypothetical protein